MNLAETKAYKLADGRWVVDLSVAQELDRQLTEANEHLAHLQSQQRLLTCVYCGKEYPPGTPTSGVPALTEHIKTCEKHPMRALQKELDRLYQEHAEIADACVTIGSDESIPQYIRRIFKELCDERS